MKSLTLAEIEQLNATEQEKRIFIEAVKNGADVFYVDEDTVAIGFFPPPAKEDVH